MRALPLAALILLVGCGSEAPASPADSDTPVPSPTADTAPPVCDGSALCARSIDACDVELTQADCETFYEPTSSCRDIDAYTSCNCDCIDEPTCDGYFACGQVCFTLHCA